METKAQIRKSYKQKRAMLNEESVRVMSEAICAAVENSAWYHEAERVGFYYPLGSEVQLTGLVTKAWAAGKKTCFPRVSGENMEFYEISDFSQLEEGCFHVMEPVESCAEPVVPELILIPGVVFDGFGNRAGYGKGYYDRYLTGTSGLYPGRDRVPDAGDRSDTGRTTGCAYAVSGDGGWNNKNRRIRECSWKRLGKRQKKQRV